MEQPDLLIRDYRSEDFGPCQRLWVELTQRHRDIYDDQSIGGDDPGSAFEPYLRTEGLRGPWVAEVGGQVVGFTGLLVSGEEAEIEPVIVTADRRSHGIGGRLVVRATEEARRLGIRYLNVRPVARNVEAIAFFVRAGFDAVGRIDLVQDLSGRDRPWLEGLTIHGNELGY
jgi:GNAT superfamily N-acetyltransferase